MPWPWRPPGAPSPPPHPHIPTALRPWAPSVGRPPGPPRASGLSHMPFHPLEHCSLLPSPSLTPTHSLAVTPSKWWAPGDPVSRASTRGAPGQATRSGRLCRPVTTSRCLQVPGRRRGPLWERAWSAAVPRSSRQGFWTVPRPSFRGTQSPLGRPPTSGVWAQG